MSGRNDILGNIRARLGRDADNPAPVDERIATHAPGPLPARGEGTAEELRARFVEMARKASADVEQLGAIEELPGLVGGICGAHGFDAAAAIAPHPSLDALSWADAGIAIEARRGQPDDRLCVSHAVCGVAETGTLVLASGPQSPITLNFLPDVHVVAIPAEAIVGTYEHAWSLMRARGAMPRAVNWITGPSRSADIEQTLQLGAHGPIRLVIALYG
ncbi:LutC/YkgG family protein [Halofilum ochraceum]|uniref:LutC/YkgG family protein n=1 Tax=Halofilum ochraceum TaxID=1611323 RepID=UPI0009F5BA68|nr:lactate utilization protein [Halofilum ochraceum]